MRKLLLVLCAALTLGAATANADTVVLINDNFDGGLSIWSPANAVLGTGGIAGTLIIGQYANLGASIFDGTSSISQTVHFVDGYDSLSLSFDWYFNYSANNSRGQEDLLLSILSDNGTELLHVTLASASQTELNEIHGNFSQTFAIADTGQDPAHTVSLTFQLLEDDGNNEDSVAAIDNVNLTVSGPGPEPAPNPVPEPATLLLLGLGLVGIAGLKFTKK